MTLYCGTHNWLCVQKMLNHGFFLSLFKLISCPVHSKAVLVLPKTAGFAFELFWALYSLYVYLWSRYVKVFVFKRHLCVNITYVPCQYVGNSRNSMEREVAFFSYSSFFSSSLSIFFSSARWHQTLLVLVWLWGSNIVK